MSRHPKPLVRPTTLLLALGIALIPGCVSKKKYIELENVLARTRQAVKDRDEERRDFEKRLEECAADRELLEVCEMERSRVLAEKGQLTHDVEAMTTAMIELARQQKEAQARIDEYKAVVAKFRELEAAGKLKVRIHDGKVIVELATDVLFASGKAALSPAGKDAVIEVAAILATLTDKQFQIEGHTDDVPIRTGQFPSNWELASARAITVVKALIEGGMPPESVSAASFAEFRPVTANDTPEHKAANRRIEIVMVPDLSQLPGFDELEKMSTGR